MKSPEVVQAEMSKDIEFIKLDMAEMKNAMRKMSESLDNLAIKWQEIGGLMNGLAGLNGRVNEIELEQKEMNKRLGTLETLKLRSEGAVRVLMLVVGLAGSMVGLVVGQVFTRLLGKVL